MQVTAHEILYCDSQFAPRGWLLLGTDITEQKHLAKQLAQSQKLESIGMLAAGIAHEINTPIQFIGDNLRFIEGALLPLLASFKEAIDFIDQHDAQLAAKLRQESDYSFIQEETPDALTQSMAGVKRITDITSAMRMFSHPGGKTTEVDLNATIRDTCTVSFNHYKHHADIDLQLSDGLPMLRCDPTTLSQVMLNLVINAGQAIEDVDRPKFRGRICITTTIESNIISCSVSDNGCGISPATQEKVFDHFFTTKAVGRGTGQGLSFVHDFVTNHMGGKVYLESQEGIGSQFILHFPIKNHRTRNNMTKPVNAVLFIDDDNSLLAGLRRSLRRDFNVHTALGGELGLKVLAEHPEIAVVVVDMRMPGMNGIETLHAIREKHPHLIRIMLTGNNDLKTAMDAVNSGSVFRFLLKPCENKHLTQTIHDALRQYQLEQSERQLLEQTLTGAINALCDIMMMHDEQSFFDTPEGKADLEYLCHQCNIKDLWEISIACQLHRVGMVAIPPEVIVDWQNGKKLNYEYSLMVEEIPVVGSQFLNGIPRLQGVANMIMWQDKHYDGTGYPVGSLAGDKIPIGSRIIKILKELYAELTRGMTREQALLNLERRQGTFDPYLLALMLNREKKIEQHSPSNLCQDIEELPPHKLRTGHLIVEDIRLQDGGILLAAGNYITAPLLQRLINFAKIGRIPPAIRVNTNPGKRRVIT